MLKITPLKKYQHTPPTLITKNQPLGPFKVSIFLRPVLLEEAYTNDRLCINYACITCLLYYESDVNVRRSRSHDSRFPAMIYIKTSFQHDCQCKQSISVMKACIKVTYGDVSKRET